MTESLTFPQRRALGELMRATTRRSAKSIFTRQDVLWRLEERGLVARNGHDQWRITADGEAAYEAWWEKQAAPCGMCGNKSRVHDCPARERP